MIPSSWVTAVVASLFSISLGSIGYGADQDADLTVVATVSGETIYKSEVERELKIALGTRKISEDALPYFQAKTLDQLIDRRLIVGWLSDQGRGASATEVDLEISRLTKRLATREITLATHLVALGLTEVEMRRLIEWQISWRKFLARYQTDENLEKYFNDHRRDFDGTRMRVAHILFKVNGDSQDEVKQIIDRANNVRKAITSGSITFAEAAKQHSTAPTANEGGDVGFIERHKPMHETFSRAAFALNKGEISPPTVTPFGVHLIHCLEIQPGQRTWQDAQDELTTAVTRYLFDWAADQQRKKAAITFTNTYPHFQPGTDKLGE